MSHVMVCCTFSYLTLNICTRIRTETAYTFITSGIHGGYRLVSTYDLPDSKPFLGGGEGAKTENTQSAKKWLNFNFWGGGGGGILE